MDNLMNVFIQTFGGTGDEIRSFFTPGRINIIGEHIDYNGGYVLPCSLKMGTHALIRKRGDDTARFASTNFDLQAEIPLDDVAFDPAHDWANYPKGIVRLMQDDGHTIGGFDILFSGDIPNAAGLSSSASIELVTATALNDVFSLGYEPIELVKLSQRAENQFCGVNCGIMDQFAVGMGKDGHAIYLHCDTLDYKHVPLNLGGYTIVVMNTNKRRQLNESKYNERRSECEQALAFLLRAKSASTSCQFDTKLTDLTPEAFAELSHLIPDETLRRRARHVIQENERVKQAVAALESGDMETLGELLNQSHASLRDDYEVTGLELDTLVSEAQKNPVCIGARMTGAGFGGCAIALMKKDAVDGFAEGVIAGYEKVVGYAPSLY
ncbi:MAG: galactokinase [Defluviitaleaceae bacterium]|nr:galactokinase [Defluviitaleaceae bacterium]